MTALMHSILTKLRLHKYLGRHIDPEVVKATNRDGRVMANGLMRPRLWKGGVLLWFDWTEISARMGGTYGAYVYRNLLPLCAGAISAFDPGRYYLFDGDVLARGTLSIPHQGPIEKHCLNRVKAIGTEKCYVVGILGSGYVDWGQVDRELSHRAIAGYLGRTTWPGAEYEEFDSLMDNMAIPCALELRAGTVRKIDFHMLRDDELRNMGFTVLDTG